MNNEFETIFDASIFYMPINKGSERGVLLQLNERQHRIQLIRHRGFVWLDQRTAQELALLPDNYEKRDDRNLEIWVKKNLPGNTIRISDHLNKKVVDKTEATIRFLFTKLDSYMAEFGVASFENEYERIKNILERGIRGVIEESRTQDIESDIMTSLDNLLGSALVYGAKIATVPRTGSVNNTVSYFVRHVTNSEPKDIQNYRKSFNSLLRKLYDFMDILAKKLEIDFKPLRVFFLDEFNGRTAEVSDRISNPPSYGDRKDLYLKKIVFVYGLGYTLNGRIKKARVFSRSKNPIRPEV